MIAPKQAKENAPSHAYIQSLLESKVIDQVHYVDLRESMRNGGGPACLRLRVALTERELQAIRGSLVAPDR